MYRALAASFSVSKRLLCASLAIASLISLFSALAHAQSEEEEVDVAAIFNQAQDLHEKGDLAGAIKLYDKALKAMPEFPEAEYQRAIAYIALGKPSEAEAAYRRAIELRPDWTLAMTGLGVLLVNRGRPAEAEPLLRKVLETEPQDPAAVAAFAEIRLQSRAPQAELRSLLARLVELTAKAKPVPSLWVTRAALETALGNAAAARSSLARALEIDPKNRSALFQLADLSIADGDAVGARQILGSLESGSNAVPVSDSVRLIRANILALELRYTDALAELDAIKVSAPPVEDLRKRINAIRSTDPLDLERQLASDEKNVVILSRLCSLYRRDDPAKALAFCRRAAEAEPGNINHAVGFGAALVQTKRFDDAALLFSKIIATVPDNATARANLATALFQLKRYPEAKIQFHWLAAAQPAAAGAYLFLGIIHDELAEYTEAAANYQMYLKLADPVANKLDLDKVTLRLPAVEKLIREGKGKKK